MTDSSRPDRGSSAADLASTPVVAVRSEAEAMTALYEMYRNKVHHLAVVAGDDAVGLVSEADLMHGIAAEYPRITAAVSSLCRSPGPRVDAADDIGTAAQRMVEANADAVLVMRNGHLCGVLTAVDLVRNIAEGARPERSR